MRKFDRVLLTAWMLNVYDAGITVYATQVLRAEELNPLMRFFLDSNPVVFVVFKLMMMTLVCSILRRRFELYAKKTWTTLTVITCLLGALAIYNSMVLAALV